MLTLTFLWEAFMNLLCLLSAGRPPQYYGIKDEDDKTSLIFWRIECRIL